MGRKKIEKPVVDAPPVVDVQPVVDASPVNVDQLAAKFGVFNQRTGKPITRKMSFAHAIESVLSDSYQTVAAIKLALSLLGVDATEKRIANHCWFYTSEAGKRKTPSIQHDGNGGYRRIADKSWFTANIDGTAKPVKPVKPEAGE